MRRGHAKGPAGPEAARDGAGGACRRPVPERRQRKPEASRRQGPPARRCAVSLLRRGPGHLFSIPTLGIGSHRRLGPAGLARFSRSERPPPLEPTLRRRPSLEPKHGVYIEHRQNIGQLFSPGLVRVRLHTCTKVSRSSGCVRHQDSARKRFALVASESPRRKRLRAVGGAKPGRILCVQEESVPSATTTRCAIRGASQGPGRETPASSRQMQGPG